ncbi:MAG: rare lipoprotein [Desulfovibrionales bacterium]|jgi:rare lipoprotein A|nr:rare lipoprotein [Desulfovibrionales bacterium]
MNSHSNTASSHIGRLSLLLVLAGVFALAGCGKQVVYYPAYPGGYAKQSSNSQAAVKNPKTKPYSVLGKTYYPLSASYGYNEVGTASWYGEDFHGKLTATGDVYNMYNLTAAHKTLPLGTVAEVTNLENGRKVQVLINDRGPFVDDRLIDLSYGAAKALGSVEKGLARVRVRALSPAVGTQVAGNGGAGGSYYVQVGAYSEPPNARQVHAKLVRAGYEGSRITSIQRSGRTLHGVQAGVFDSLPQAKQALARLRQYYPSSYIASR